MSRLYSETLTNDELALLPAGSFAGEIVVVDTHEAIAEACDYLAQCPVIGFDTETRPSFSKGVTNRVALLQLSSEKRAFLFRINKIALERPILRLMENRSIVKVGVAIRDDLRALQQLRRFVPKNFVELQGEVGSYGIKEMSLRKMAGIVLGIKITKAQRLSNWEGKSLTPAQQAYAATDAWVGQAIYCELCKREKIEPQSNAVVAPSTTKKAKNKKDN